MIKFKKKEFSKKEALKSVGRYLKDHPLLPLSALTATVSTANYVTNQRREKKDHAYQQKQLEAMDRLTNSLNNTTNVMERVENKRNYEKQLSGDGVPTPTTIRFIKKRL